MRFRKDNTRIRILLALGLNLLVACGSPLIEGWRDDDKDTRTEEERCEASPGWSWLDGACVKDSDGVALDQVQSESDCRRIEETVWLDNRCLRGRALTGEQCARVSGWAFGRGQCRPAAEAACVADETRAFVGGQCVDRPTLTVRGDLAQTVVPGQAIRSLDLEPSAGAEVVITTTSCEGYFKIVNRTLGSVDGLELKAGTTECRAELVARQAGADSVPVTVIVTLAQGFRHYCESPDAPQSALLTVYAIVAALEKPDCAEAAKALADVTTLKLVEAGISDLSPLRGLTRLTWLDLTGNGVVDLAPLADLPALAFLDLRFNRVESLAPLAKAPALRFLRPDGNPIATGAVKKTEDNCPTGAAVNARVRSFCKGE